MEVSTTELRRSSIKKGLSREDKIKPPDYPSRRMAVESCDQDEMLYKEGVELSLTIRAQWLTH